MVLPSRFPNLLVNGSGGIAVGMATNIPPHNLGEVIDAVVHYLEQPESTPKDLMKFVKGPDFPTGAIIMGRDGIRDAYETGRGSIKIRAVSSVEEGSGGRARIVVTELPYQVNKARLAEKIAELVKRRQGEGHRRPEGPLIGPCGDAARDRPEARREPPGRPEPALQAHPAPGVLRRDHAGAGRRGSSHAEPRRDDRLLRRPPDRRGHPADALRPAQGRGARPHRPRPPDRAGSPRRGHQGDPGLGRTRSRRAPG